MVNINFKTLYVELQAYLNSGNFQIYTALLLKQNQFAKKLLPYFIRRAKILGGDLKNEQRCANDFQAAEISRDFFRFNFCIPLKMYSGSKFSWS